MSMYVIRSESLKSEKKVLLENPRYQASTFENVVPMYDNFHYLLNVCSSLYSPELFYNSDETAIVLDGNDKSKVITLSGDEYDIMVRRGPRNSTISAFFTIRADGLDIKPVIITNTTELSPEFVPVHYSFFCFILFMNFHVFSWKGNTTGK
jgi:hypothetical protein